MTKYLCQKNSALLLALLPLISGSLIIISCDSSSGSFNSGGSNFTIEDIETGRINPEFQPTVDRFVFEAAKRNISVDLEGLSIQYSNTEGALGKCIVSGSDRAITINPALQNASQELLDEIIIHELGHCVLDRVHSDDPTSIMHATIIIGQPFREEVLDELFFGN